MQAVQNLGLAIVTIVSGLIVDKAGYLILEVFFLANLCIALITGKRALALDHDLQIPGLSSHFAITICF
jgi:hypothetical protein